MTTRLVVAILNPGQSPADNGRTVHALDLAVRAAERGADVVVTFEGEGVRWLPRFLSRDEDSHPFVKRYGPKFDAVRERVRACNMCCIRFDVRDEVAAAGIPILGEGQDHVDVAAFALDGYTIVNH